jgi:uracil-DNA glycosylase
VSLAPPLAPPFSRCLDDASADWAPLVQRWRASDTGLALSAFVDARLAAGATIYPPQPLRALALTPLAGVRVVILGQDPYHGAGQAEGLAFSVPPGVRPPPSLRNIFKELQRDLRLPMPPHGHLGAWAQRGVLLLNTCLTVEDGAAASHAGRGWEALTDRLIEAAAAAPQPKVFMLWGTHAQRKQALIDGAGPAHLVLQCNHPSPLSATRGPVPFIGCRHFSAATEFLAAHGITIDWRLPGIAV